jgi:hypothetical protein
MCVEIHATWFKKSYMWMNICWLLSVVTSYAQLQSSAAFPTSLR